MNVFLFTDTLKVPKNLDVSIYRPTKLKLLPVKFSLV